MNPFADILLNPGGLISGWLAGSVMGGGGYGIAADLISAAE